MTCNTSAHLFSIPRHTSMRPIVGTLGLFHFQEAMCSPFLHWVLRLTPYLLQLLLRHQLLLKIQTFKRNDPFSVADKKGRERFCGVIREFLFLCLYLCTLLCGHVVFGIWTCVCSTHFVLWNLFWGWHEPLYGQISFMISVLSLGSYVSLSFCWYLIYIFYVWCVAYLYSYVSFVNQPLTTCFGGWRLLVGWRKSFVHTPL